MNFSKELCQFVMRNCEPLEGGIFDAIEKPLFKAINTRLKKRLSSLGGWKGVYKLVSGEANETLFAPAVWPESQDGRYRACYKLNETGDKNYYWLSCALGANGVRMCLRLWVHGGLGGRAKSEVERKLFALSQVPVNLMKCPLVLIVLMAAIVPIRSPIFVLVRVTPFSDLPWRASRDSP